MSLRNTEVDSAVLFFASFAKRGRHKKILITYRKRIMRLLKKEVEKGLEQKQKVKF